MVRHTVFLLTCLASSAFAAANPVLLDDFEYGSLSVADATDDGLPFVTTTIIGLSPSHTVGGQRAVGVYLADGLGPITATLSPDDPDTLNDALTFTNPAGSDGVLDVTYNGGSSLGLNLSGCDRFEVMLSASPSNGGISMMLEDADGTSGRHGVSATGPGTYYLLFTDFSNSPSIDFSNIASVSVRLSDGDYGVTELWAVPEPSPMQLVGTLVVVLMGFAVFRYARRRSLLNR